ncbi:hypothetical protein B0T22DRAFT_437319 [Podospora appendiculata]|uniref:N-acetyltransferase domain-containing protein n=1 Tax=Podospora appendiculata TaxID=314037 RepID=A0AAE0XJS8_9PEZI|nr:hypothetical protein B0T22DRAFT_437319 [Podospora appendiculata]
MRIRSAQLTDVDRLVEIYIESLKKDPFTHLYDKSMVVIVAEKVAGDDPGVQKDTVVGHCTWEFVTLGEGAQAASGEAIVQHICSESFPSPCFDTNNTFQIFTFSCAYCPRPSMTGKRPEPNHAWCTYSPRSEERIQASAEDTDESRVEDFASKGITQWFSIEQLAAHPDHRKQGVGRHLVSWGFEKADRLGYMCAADCAAGTGP